jgi:Fe-S cluster biosynthesis and repair protein YggX
MSPARMVFCKKLQKDLPGLAFKPWPNALGAKVYESISQDAWKMWTAHVKMIMHEDRLAGGTEDANRILFEQAEKFFFGEGAALPPDYKAPSAKG